MNNIDSFLANYKQQIDDMVVKQGPTSEEIYQELCKYNSSNNSLEQDVSAIVSYVDSIIKKYIGTYLNQGSGVDLVYLNKNKGQYLKYIEICFNKHMPSINESIQLYFSINDQKYQDFIMPLFQYLLNKKISFNSRLSKVDRNDNFILILYSKEDVRNLIQYINSNNLHDCLRSLNPFIYQVNNIGIVKDTSKYPYNKYLSDILQEYFEECILKQQNNPYTDRDLQRFIAYKCEDAKSSIDRVMSYNLACSLYSIITKEDILNRINDQYKVSYVPELLKKYPSLTKDNDKYYLNDREIDYPTVLAIKMNKCLFNMYKYKKGKEPITNYQLNSDIVNIILNDLENIQSYNICNICLDYNDDDIKDLIPYLYAFIAKKYKFCNDIECHKIINVIKEKAVYLKENTENYKYQINDQVIKSSIPIIQTKEGFCLIEFIDNEIVNINTIENGKIKSYLNVYVDVDQELLKNSQNYYGRLYRNAIASALLDDNRNRQALHNRENNFSAQFLSDKEEMANKYVNVNSIKKIYRINSEKISKN